MNTKSRSGKIGSATAKPEKSDKKSKAKPPARLAGAKPPRAGVAATRSKTVSAPATSADKACRTQPEAAGNISAKAGGVTAPNPPAAPGAVTELKKRELIDLVVARSDVKKKYAKPVIEAMLEIIGDSVANGRELNLQPMGRVKYNRTKEMAEARVVVAKIRQNTRAKAAEDTVADTSE